MDSSDDPDITPYQLKIRARSSEHLHAKTHSDGEEKKFFLKKFIIRTTIACLFIGGAVAVLIWAISREEPGNEDEPLGVEAPIVLNLAHSEACYSGGTVKITTNNKNFAGDKKSALLPSVWLHNHEKQQLKITLGDRNANEISKWIMDIYFLQYGTYVISPSDINGDMQRTCKVDWTSNYASFVAGLESAKFHSKNTSRCKNLFKSDAKDNEIWTNEAGLLCKLTQHVSFTSVEYVYDNMQSEAPQFDDDILSAVRMTCDIGDLEEITTEIVKKHMASLP